MGERVQRAAEPARVHHARLSERQNFSIPDAVNDDEMNRILWHAAKGSDAPYPAGLAGAHGKGLTKLGLELTGGGRRVRNEDD